MSKTSAKINKRINFLPEIIIKNVLKITVELRNKSTSIVLLFCLGGAKGVRKLQNSLTEKLLF